MSDSSDLYVSFWIKTILIVNFSSLAHYLFNRYSLIVLHLLENYYDKTHNIELFNLVCVTGLSVSTPASVPIRGFGTLKGFRKVFLVNS